MSIQSKISIRNIFKIFGPSPDKVLNRAVAGESKSKILAETGHTLGIKGVSLEIKAGEIFVIMGLSGSGKSTLIRHFNRLIEPTAGQILIDGDDVLSMNGKQLTELRRSKVSMVFQKFALLPHKTVLENVYYGLAIRGESKQECISKATHWIEQVGLKGYEAQYPTQLSGGMQQRVGLARALATDSDVLLMDEAFSALDPLIRNDMQEQLIQLQKKLKKTIVFITHDLDEALRLGDHIAILKDGELRQVGTPEDILLHPADDYVSRFVQDVNRGRVITVGSVAAETPTLLESQLNLKQITNSLTASKHNVVYVLDDQRKLKGVITREMLKKAKPENQWQQALEDAPTVESEVVLEEMLPLVVSSHMPVAVVDSDGCFVGSVSHRDAVVALTPSDESENHSSTSDVA